MSARLKRAMSPAAGSSRPDVSRGASDRDPGTTLLLLFLGATAVVVADVVLAAAVDRWWILIPVMAIHFLMSFVVFTGIMRLLADGADSSAAGH